MLLIFFQLCCLSLGYFVYKPFTTVQSGPCDTTSNILQIPNSLLGPAYKQFTVEGWFKKDSLLSTSRNLLFLIVIFIWLLLQMNNQKCRVVIQLKIV
ncbi:unnamed protein product [Paramecium sonneborni]|uniref:Uncharacterized protein n=1 Tax=Paramecium sonneborni TaxID=65129 RepID=A0A8S1P8V1_9CILI|nr:unnamed protein product [Paramecium sonneborni]